ncbi:MAG: hydrolase [Holophagae bacterium]|nr:MAG: hydrolase [Holophagae bacterium]
MAALPEFRPAWWLPGPHLQAVGARLLRPRGRVRCERERFELADGDFVDLDWVIEAGGRSPDRDAPLVLVLHGLEGSSSSDYVLSIHCALASRGLASLALNFRSCSGEPNRLPRFYHSGDTGDAAAVLRLLRERFPARRIGAVGFSLGGNVLLKLLGECGGGGREGLAPDAAVAISVPFDLSAGIITLEHGLGPLYQRYFLRKLRRKLRLKAALLRGHVDVDCLLAVRTLRDFDDLATAPLHGFANSADYYRRASSKPVLGAIRVPTLLIHAADDPFLPSSAIPRAEVEASPHLNAIFPDHGGHVGFVSGPPWAPVFWAEQTAATFLAARLL